METTFLILSKNSALLLKNYIFGETQDFLKLVYECFDVINLGEEIVEIKLPSFTAYIYFCSELDLLKSKINGHVLIDLSSDLPISTVEVQASFQDFVSKTNSYLFLISEQEEKLVLRPKNVDELN
jgi:hypothetical protein